MKAHVHKPRRPTKTDGGGHTALTPELQKRICDSIRMGNYVEIAVGAAGISKATFYTWTKKAETGKQPYRDFTDALQKAELEGEEIAVLTIRKLSQDNRDPKTLLDVLSRRSRKRWSRSDAVTIGAGEGVTGSVEIKMSFADH